MNRSYDRFFSFYVVGVEYQKKGIMNLIEFFNVPDVASFLRVQRGFDKADELYRANTDIRRYLSKVDLHVLRDIDRQFDIVNPHDHSPEGALRGWVDERCTMHT